MVSSLDQSILKTIVYFDCLDRALTATETYFYLAAVTTSEVVSHSFMGILQALEEGSSLRTYYVDEKNGYYFLKSRERLYEERIERLKTADRLWKKMRRVARWMQMAPYVRLVMASGSLGMQHMTTDSDLDVLVVVKHGRIWTGRFFLTVLMHVLGVRRHGEHVAGRVCLNHYITDQSLSIPFHSLYNAMTYAQLVPIYERSQPKEKFISGLPRDKKPAVGADFLRDHSIAPDRDTELPINSKYSKRNNFVKRRYVGTSSTLEARGIEPPDLGLTIPYPRHAAPRAFSLYQDDALLTTLFNRFQQANAWIKDYLPHWRSGSESLRAVQLDSFLVALATSFEWCLDSVWGDLLERLLRRAQLKRIERHRETYAAGGRVRADDMMLEFHPNSPEKTIIDRFNSKMMELGLQELSGERDSGLV